MNAPARIFPPPILTRGQRQVLELAMLGLEGADMARRLGISAGAVERALQGARQRIGARNTAHLCALALAFGILDPRALIVEHAAARRAGLHAAEAGRG